MAFEDKICQWSKAHVFYNMYEHEPDNNAPQSVKDDYIWRMRLLKETPNGSFIIKNSFFNSLKEEKIYLLHTTPNLEGILRSGSLYSSGGCLVGGIYATPLFKKKNLFHLHNLGEYIVKKEAKKASYMQNSHNPINNLLIEVELPTYTHSNLIGIDYLKIGNIHFDIYKELEYLLSFEERVKLHDSLLIRIKHSLSLLSLASNSYSNHKKPDAKLFFDLLVSAIDHLPILGYMYFEVVSEFIMLHEKSANAQKYHKIGELYNWTYKDLMFDLFPDLLKGYGLGIFKPELNLLLKYINKKKIIPNFDPEYTSNLILERLLFLINTRLLNLDHCNMGIDWKSVKWTFNDLSLFASQLLGHLLHRELRNFGRYPDFYFYFDQFKALQIWNYWNHMDILIPFNGFIPKGELGINPACPNMKYNIYKGKIFEENEGLVIEPVEKLNLKIIPRLVDVKHAIMRSKDPTSINNKNNG